MRINPVLFFLHIRLLRDTTDRGRSVEGSLTQYNRFVYPAFMQHIEPTMQYADLVVPNGVLTG